MRQHRHINNVFYEESEDYFYDNDINNSSFIIAVKCYCFGGPEYYWKIINQYKTKVLAQIELDKYRIIYKELEIFELKLSLTK